MTEDIPKREKLDHKLRNSPDLLAGIIASTMDSIIVLDEAQRIVLFNAAAEEIFGCPADEAMGTSIEHFIPQRFRAEHRGHVRRFAATSRTIGALGTPWGLRSTGEKFPIEVSISRFEAGKKSFSTVVIRDITKSLLAEEAMQESEQRFRLIADSAPVLLWMSGTDKLCTYFNKPWLEFTGRSLESELGNGWTEGVHPEDFQKCLGTYTQSFDRREKFRMEYRLRQHDGEYRWILDVGVPRFDADGSFAGYIGIGVDISERKRVEQERLLSESQFRQFFETMPEYCYMVSPSGEIVDTNLAACAALGYTKDELMGKPLTALYAPECVPKMRELFKKWKENGELRNEEMIVITKHGERRTVLLNAGSVRDSSGNILHSTSVHVDITERKRADEALQQREMELIEAQRLAGVGSWQWEPRTDTVIWSKELYHLMGVDPTLPAPSYKEHAHLFAAESWERLQRAVQGAFQTGTSYALDLEVVRPESIAKWEIARGEPVRDKSGQIIGLRGTVQDITERKQAEESLRESEDKLRLLLDSTAEAIYGIDLEHRCTFCNSAFLRALGYERIDEVLGKNTHDLIHHSHADGTSFPAEECRVHRVLRTGEGDHAEDEVLWRANGTSFPAEYWSYPQRRGQELVGAVVAFIDITERKRAEEAVKESETRFRLVADTAPVMIWMSGLDKKPTYFNQLWLDFTGLSETDLLNGLVGITHPEDYPECHDIYSRGFDQRQPFRKECRLRRHDGQYRWMLDIGVPRFHKDGSFAGYIGSCIDVTDHKLAEEALSNMTRKLVAAQEQERTRIARELHDDIGQRLALLAIEVQQLHKDPLIVRKVRRRMGKLQEQILGIAADTQSLSHELHSAKLQYLGIAAAMRGFCREFGEQQKMEIDFNAHDLPSPLSPDISLCLFRVLQEALHNSGKHSGVKHFEVRLWGTSEEIHLSVKDSGAGFDREAAKMSRGLGLISMEERLKLVNGTLSVESKPMGGTTVHARVPLRSEQDSQRAAG